MTANSGTCRRRIGSDDLYSPIEADDNLSTPLGTETPADTGHGVP
jgi:hypothetical protein